MSEAAQGRRAGDEVWAARMEQARDCVDELEALSARLVETQRLLRRFAGPNGWADALAKRAGVEWSPSLKADIESARWLCEAGEDNMTQENRTHICDKCDDVHLPKPVSSPPKTEKEES